MSLMLGIDTATTGCSVALMEDGQCLAEQQKRMPRGHSEALAPMLDEVMTSANISFDRLDGIAVTRGPGAFTGLRIGLAAARAMALAISKPCIGISTFESLSRQTRQREDIENRDALLVAIESKRAELFIGMYSFNGEQLHAPTAKLPEAIENITGSFSSLVVVGDAAEKIENVLRGRIDVRRIKEIEVPDAKIVATLGSDFLGSPELAPPTPFYLRAPDASLPKSR